MSKFYSETKYNNETKNQMWMSMISDGHDMHCKCFFPFAHLLDSIFPEGHTDRDKTVREIIERDFAAWRSGGLAEEDTGMETTKQEDIKENNGEEEGTDANLDALLAAAAADAEENTR